MSLKQKSFLFVAALMAVLLAAYISLSRYYLNQNTSRRFQESRQSTSAAARNLDDFLSRAVAKIEFVAQLPLLLNGLESIAEEAPSGEIPTSDTLHYLFLSSDIFSHVYLVNAQGHIIWSEPREQRIRNTTYEAFDQVRSGVRDETYGAVFTVRENADDQAEILLTSTLIRQDGEIAGYLIGVIPTNNPAITGTLRGPANPAINMQLVRAEGPEAGLVVASTSPTR